MEHDLRLRAAARAIYDAYPSDDRVLAGFDEAEDCRTIHYRQAVGAAQGARAASGMQSGQFVLPVFA